DYTVVRKTSDDHVAPNCHPYESRERCRSHRPIMDPPSPSLTPKSNNDKKILEVTQKITELLTGEVPIRCQDVTVYFSMEEWEYIEGHKDLYKDVMMENQPTLTSPDGSSNRNPPERCPRPLYSRDSTQEHQKVPEEVHFEDLIVIKVEAVDEEEPDVIDDKPYKQKEIPPEISTDGKHSSYNTEECSIILPNGGLDDEVMSESPEEDLVTPSLHPAAHSRSRSSNPSAIRGCSPDPSPPVPLPTAHRRSATFQCPECSKCFFHRANLISHQRTHTEQKPYSLREGVLSEIPPRNPPANARGREAVFLFKPEPMKRRAEGGIAAWTPHLDDFTPTFVDFEDELLLSACSYRGQWKVI
ncbi:hypothetical protein AB205_0013850, partial [Aquarana catesbeiana]